jgi:DNA repair exonuclease SbcCD nuclease subunit
VLAQTGWREASADVRLLVMHHCVEGATVGPGNYTFTTASDVIRGRDLPGEFAAVLSGHIHRHQVLKTDLHGWPLPSPVLYPGSVERTAFAEKNERKGYMTLVVAHDGSRGTLRTWSFHELAARPMLAREIPVEGRNATWLRSRLRALPAELPEDAVLQLRVTGPLSLAHRALLAAPNLREIFPASMNVDLVIPEYPVARRQAPKGRAAPPEDGRPKPASGMLELGL